MIGLVTLFSELETAQNIEHWKNGFIGDLLQEGGIEDKGVYNNRKDLEQMINRNGFSALIILIATGGTELFAEFIIKRLSAPILLWSHPDKNSTASALEITGAFRGLSSLTSVYGYYKNEKCKNRIRQFIKICNVINKVSRNVSGFIGSDSDWLLVSKKTASNDYLAYTTEITTGELKDNYKKIKDTDVDLALEKLEKCIDKGNITDPDLRNAVKVYLALKAICGKYKLSSLTLRCFDLLKEKYTACLALAMLNDEGIVSGCEGDKHALLSMIIAQALNGRTCWMANPSSLDFEKKEIVFAHCSVPFKMLDEKETVMYDTHMESGLSVAIAGSLRQEDVTVFRLGDNFNKLLAVRGKVISKNDFDSRWCRTQARIELNGDLERWYESSLGNHQIIAYGDMTEDLRYFCKLMNIEFVGIE